MVFELTPSQLQAYDVITTTLPQRRIILLQGSAGTGKTTLTKSIVNYFQEEQNMVICAIAPTHKAKRVIANILNQHALIQISAMTVCSALSKIKEHSYIGVKTYRNSQIKKLSMFQLFILDEVSMVSDVDLKKIIDFVRTHRKMLLIIGDSNQIPCPSAKYKITNVLERQDSFIFTDDSIFKLELSEIVRQAQDSPIIKLATYVRDHLRNDFVLADTAYKNLISSCDLYVIFEQLYAENPSSKIIAYTNQAVKFHNTEVRSQLQYQSPFVIGEALMGYNNLGWPELIIENGQDYTITRIRPTKTHSIGIFNNLVGRLIDLRVFDDHQSSTDLKGLFFINLNHPNNKSFMTEMISRGQKVNSPNSTKLDYQKYNELKYKVLFTENIYHYNGHIYTETIFKETHPLLFTNINEVIESKDGEMVISNHNLYDKIEKAYPDLISKRIADVSKIFGESEQLAGQYEVIEKDIDYGYAITAHKAQGSTYHAVIVDENDFQKIANRWNYRHNKQEVRIKEKNQLKYVSYTRAKEILLITTD